MNQFVADPHWNNWMVIAYFFLGGIAAGSYFMAALGEIVGSEEDRRVIDIAYYIAFPLVAICGILLIIDLSQPMRFWHMVFQSERFPLPMIKYWSPMSIGSWGLLLFSAFSFASFVGVLARDRRFGLGRFADLAEFLHRGLPGFLFQLGGAISGFFLAGYTGALLTATNQPIWSDTNTITGLFIASAASTGISAMLLGNRLFRKGAPHHALEKLEDADAWAMGLELVMIIVFLVSLGGLVARLFITWPGWLLLIGVVLIGLLVPLALHFRPAILGRNSPVVAAALGLLGGLLLRIAVVSSAPASLALVTGIAP